MAYIAMARGSPWVPSCERRVSPSMNSSLYVFIMTVASEVRDGGCSVGQLDDSSC